MSTSMLPLIIAVIAFIFGGLLSKRVMEKRPQLARYSPIAIIVVILMIIFANPIMAGLSGFVMLFGIPSTIASYIVLAVTCYISGFAFITFSGNKNQKSDSSDKPKSE